MAESKDRTTFVVIALKTNRELDIQLGTGTTQTVVAGERVNYSDLVIGQKYEGFVNGKYLNYVFAPKFTKDQPKQPTITTTNVGTSPFKPANTEVIALTLTKDQAYELEKLLDNHAVQIRNRAVEVMKIPMTMQGINSQVFQEIFNDNERFITNYIKPITKQLESYRGKQ
jgi:Icc-related predicted phosphoesterase